MVFFKHTYLYTNERFFNRNFFFYEFSSEKFADSNSSLLKSSNEKFIVIKIVRDTFFCYFPVYVGAIAYVAIWYSFAVVRAIDGKLKYSGAVAFHAGLTFRSVFRRTR